MEAKLVEYKDMIVGEFYRANKMNVFMHSGNSRATYFIETSDNDKSIGFNKNGGHFAKSSYYLASDKEKAWLQECIKQDRYVPLSEITIKSKLIKIW